MKKRARKGHRSRGAAVREHRRKNRAIMKAIGRGAKATARGWWKMAKATHAPKRKAAESASKVRGRRASDKKTAPQRDFSDAEIRQMIKDRDPRISARPHRANPHRGAIAAIDKKISAVRKQLCRREKIDTMSAASWQKAWDKHPALRAKETALFRKRGQLQLENPKKHSRTGRRRNTLEESARKHQGVKDAASMYAKFHGKPAGEVITIHEREIARKDYAKLGDLVKLEVDGKHCLVFKEGEGTILACDPKGKQLYIIGGTQNVDGSLATLGVDAGKDLIDLGDCTQIEYFTRKAFDQFKPVVYYHEFGEESGVCPRLMYNRLNKRLFLVGGEYDVKPEGIMN